jgi:hypothetical protein
MRVVSESEAVEAPLALYQEARTQAVIIRNGDEDVCAIVSMEDYEVVRKAKTVRLLRAMDDFGRELRSAAADNGVSLDELERTLDRKAL